MSKSRLEWKVGLFVFIGLALIGALLLEFSKGVTFFQKTYDIYLTSPNVGGLKNKAGVLMSGVQVGTVADIQLAPDGRTVTITLRILNKSVIHKDARFVIEQAGFLGDQYVAIVPTHNELPPFRNGDPAQADAPFNLQEFTRSASGFIARVDETIKKLNDSLADVTRILLNPETLTNLSVTAANLRNVSERGLVTMDSINAALETNTPALSESASNLVLFSKQLNEFAAQIKGLVATNTDDINRTVKNVEASSESLKNLAADLEKGEGLAGNLLKNPELAARASEIANNLSVTTSNLNRLGLWRVLWPHKPPRTNPPPPEPLRSPKAAE
jgi:phospholipid/cholesterol/gamma-HCH transport system substrate-binding protein